MLSVANALRLLQADPPALQNETLSRGLARCQYALPIVAELVRHAIRGPSLRPYSTQLTLEQFPSVFSHKDTSNMLLPSASLGGVFRVASDRPYRGPSASLIIFTS